MREFILSKPKQLNITHDFLALEVSPEARHEINALKAIPGFIHAIEYSAFEELQARCDEAEKKYSDLAEDHVILSDQFELRDVKLNAVKSRCEIYEKALEEIRDREAERNGITFDIANEALASKGPMR